MKDRNYFPFERNRYYYGKLLSVEDFQREQAYMNHKRRLLNRLLYGDGILCGMQVLQVDEESISIETGAALDELGREIIIEQPMIKRLSVIDGFAEYCMEGEHKPLFLCLSYQEEAAEPVYSIGGAYNEEGKQQEFNIWREGYHLFLTSEEPADNTGLPDDGYETVKTIFCGQGIRIRAAVPKYLQQNQEGILRLLVDRREGTETVSFQCEAELTGADWSGADRLNVSFREEEWEPSGHYEIEYRIRAAAVELEGHLRFLPDSFVLERGGYAKNYPIEGRFSFQVMKEKKEQALCDAWRQSAMEELWNPLSQPPLYLAEINVIPAGDTYVIEKVQNLPYHQYVWNNRLLGMLKGMELAEGLSYQPHPVERYRGESFEHARNAGDVSCVSGNLDISLGIGGAVGQTFYSEEVVHGLGPGAVFLSAGVVRQKKKEREIVYGSPEVFSREQGVVHVEIAVKLYMDRGSFIIGLHCLEEIQEDRLTVHWLAIRDQKDVQADIPESIVMTIRPNMPRISVRQSVRLEAYIGEERQNSLQWRIIDPEGGSMDDNGLYTAPNRAGIYEVRAHSMESALEASVYIIVGEE